MKKKINKSSKTGKFVSDSEMQSNPDSTYSQTVEDFEADANLLWHQLGNLLASLNKAHLDENELSAFNRASEARKLITKKWYGKQGVADAEVVEK